MATLITKNSSTTTSVPIPSQLVQGELAVNVTDKRLFTEDSGGSVVEVGTNPSSLTLSSGTANGVAYLDGTKVLTSTSAFTWNGGSIFTVGNGSSSITHYLNGSDAAGASLVGRRNGVNKWIVGDTINVLGSGTGLINYVYGDNPTIWYNNNAEQMRLTSTGLGIGTTSPAYKLDVAGTIRSSGTAATTFNSFISTGTTTGANFVTLENTSGNARFGVEGSVGGVLATDTTAYATVVGAANGPAVQFIAGGSVRATIDSAGNLGLGVTPSAWASSGRINLPDAGALVSQGTALDIGTNWYFNAGFKYATTATATWYQQTTGAHKWYNAPSGTAGAAISFTQAMTLDASGNLLVGRTGNAAGAGRVVSQAAGANYSYSSISGNATTQYHIWFGYGDTKVGDITSNNTNTAYNTSSDYRLKNITGPITTSGAYIDSLKPVEGTWKADGSTFVGLIAHETQEVSRTTVATGTKDGEEMQGMDYSSAEIIANLIAEIQDLRKRLAAAGI